MNEGAISGADSFLLAFDTSTPLGSVAVSAGTEVLARAELKKQGAHSSELLPKIRETLDEGGVDLSEVSGLVVGAGPGSFTGVRVAVATAKGLAQALEVPLWPISSLEAGAAAVDAPWVPLLPRYVLFDARSDRVYAACYLPTERGLEELIAPHSTTIGEILSGGAPMSVFVGDGAARHADEIRGAGFTVLAPPLGMPTADGLFTVLGSQPTRAPLDDIARWEPDYLRPSSAERLSKTSS